MKRLFLLLGIALGTLTGMAQDYFYVEKTDGSKVRFAYNEVLKISFEKETYTALYILPSMLEISIGQQRDLTLSYEPTDAPMPSVSWYSSDPAVVAVDNNGRITAFNEGTATIVASLGNLSANATITVDSPLEIPDIDIPEGAITVAEARAICAELEYYAQTTEKYYVKGWIKKLANKHADGVTSYGNALFYMVDQLTDLDDFYAYQVYGKNGEKLTSLDQVAVNDYVVIYGQLTNYNGTYETVNKGAAYIYSSSNPNFSGSTTTPAD